MKTTILAILMITTAATTAHAYGPNGPDSVADAEAATVDVARANLEGGVVMKSCGVVPGSQSSAGLELDCMAYGIGGQNLECQFGHWGQGDDGRFPDYCFFPSQEQVAYFGQVVSADTRITTIASGHFDQVPGSNSDPLIEIEFGFGAIGCYAIHGTPDGILPARSSTVCTCSPAPGRSTPAGRSSSQSANSRHPDGRQVVPIV